MGAIHDTIFSMSKEVTTEDLAIMVQNGFEKTATKDDIVEVNARFDGIDTHLDHIDTRLDHIENLLIRDHTNRIERLEDVSRQLQVKLGVDLRA